MTTPARGTRLPFEHLMAELAAFPLASEAALAFPLTRLDPMLSPPTATLWRAAERHLTAIAPGVSVDELMAMRDSCWFGTDHDRPRTLQAHLRAATGAYLEPLGGGLTTLRPALPDNPYPVSPAQGQARQAWMWLTLALPADLLLAASSSDDVLPEPDLCSPPVHDLLARGFAETHLHVGASLSFPVVWSLLCARLARPEMGIRGLTAPGAMLDEGRGLLPWLVRTSLVRLVLTDFVVSGRPGPFLDFLHRWTRPRIVRLAGPTGWSLTAMAIADVARGALSQLPCSLLRGTLADLVRAGSPESARTVGAMGELDPLQPAFPRGTGSAEQRYVTSICQYLDACDESGRPDEAAARLFWQSVRVRVLLYRHVTQRPMTPGLPWFIRFYGRMSGVRGSVHPGVLLEAAASEFGSVSGPTSLEVRTSPEESLEEIRTWISTVAERAVKTPTPRVALVLHFLKDRGGTMAEGLPRPGWRNTNADPDVKAAGCRYGWYFTTQRPRAQALATVLHRWPLTQSVVRALDVCSDELAIPTWVMRPLLAEVRRAAQEGARHLQRRTRVPPPPLRTTVHAGEDFAHLLTGLRHIDEAVEMLELREGDRIGHAVALGLDPAAWAARTGRVAMPLEDRLLDLAWEWSWWTRRGLGADAARLAYVDRSIGQLGERMFGRPVRALEIDQLRQDLADVRCLIRAGFPDGRPADAGLDDTRHRGLARGLRDRRLDRYLRDRQVFRIARTTIWIDPSGEVDALARISDGLRLEVARRGLAVEINPTSNLLIADLGDLQGHPLWRLSPPRPRPDLPPLAITVGSDDPLVFNSTLSGEYQVLFDSLILAGLTDVEALAWLDKVRRNGLERRFSLEALPKDPYAVENLQQLAPPVL